MKKTIKTLCFTLFVVCAAIWGLIIFESSKIPEELYIVSDSPVKVGTLCSLEYNGKQRKALSVSEVENGNSFNKQDLQVKLLNSIPVKQTAVTVSQRQYVVLSGEVYGTKLYTKGIIIVRMDNVKTQHGSLNPGAKAGLKTGDSIISINGRNLQTSAQLLNSFLNSGGNPLKVVYLRNKKLYSTQITPVKSTVDGKYKAGLWVRDSSAGIGTMTFFEPESGVFAALGHAICDVDTGEIIQISGGELVEAEVTGCYKGTDGDPGELCGVFENKKSGDIILNNDDGVYGIFDNVPQGTKPTAVAMRYEVKQGKAKIISEIDGNGPKYYDIEIVKINTGSGKNEKDMIIDVTDSALLEKTGGIVQGMSGSPIIQNGKLVGAVTHVFVNNSKRGYAIFADTMIKTVLELQAQTLKNKAA